MKTWSDHFDAFGLKPIENDNTPFQKMENIFRVTKNMEFENDTRERYQINAAIEIEEWEFMLDVVRDLRNGCIDEYNRTHDKRLFEIARLCEEEMKEAKARMYALKWLLAD